MRGLALFRWQKPTLRGKDCSIPFQIGVRWAKGKMMKDGEAKLCIYNTKCHLQQKRGLKAFVEYSLFQRYMHAIVINYLLSHIYFSFLLPFALLFNFFTHMPMNYIQNLCSTLATSFSHSRQQSLMFSEESGFS